MKYHHEQTMRNAFGESVKALRDQSGLSQPQVSDHLRVSQQHLWAIERGEYTPKLWTAYLIASFYDSTLDTMLGLNMPEGRIVHELLGGWARLNDADRRRVMDMIWSMVDV